MTVRGGKNKNKRLQVGCGAQKAQLHLVIYFYFFCGKVGLVMHHLKATSKMMQKPQALMLSRQIISVHLNMCLLWIIIFLLHNSKSSQNLLYRL